MFRNLSTKAINGTTNKQQHDIPQLIIQSTSYTSTANAQNDESNPPSRSSSSNRSNRSVSSSTNDPHPNRIVSHNPSSRPNHATSSRASTQANSRASSRRGSGQLSDVVPISQSSSSSVRSAPSSTAIRHWLAVHLQLHNRMKLLYKEFLSFVSSRKSFYANDANEFGVFVELGKLYDSNENAFDDEKSEIFSEINKIRLMIRSFLTYRNHINDPNINKEESLTILQEKMEKIEENLTNFKQKQRQKYIKLTLEEKELTNECNDCVQRFEAFFNEKITEQEKQPKKQKINIKNGITKSDHNNNRKLSEYLTDNDNNDNNDNNNLNDIDNEEKQIDIEEKQLKNNITKLQLLIDSSGGQYGNWEKNDHEHFWKLLQQLNNPTVLSSRFIKEIPNYTIEQVLQHYEWFKTYQQRIEQKKELITKWKNIKEIKQQIILKHNIDDKIELQHKLDKDKEKQLKQENEKIKTQVNQWKVTKMEQEKKENEIKIKLEDENKKIENNKLIQRQKELKILIENSKNQKILENLHENQLKLENEKIINELKQFDKIKKNELKQKNEQMLLMIIQKRKEKEIDEKQKEIEKNEKNLKLKEKIKVERDKTRLIKPTNAEQQRIKQIEQEKALAAEAKKNGRLNDMTMNGQSILQQTRAQPSWRVI